MHRALVIASERTMTAQKQMCEPIDNEPLERAKQSRLHGCFKPPAYMTIPEMLKVVVPDPDLWPCMKSADFSRLSFGT